MIDVNRLREKWKKKDAKAKAMVGDLRDDRPEKADKRGLGCERCLEEVAADTIHCIDGDYWICGRCAKLYRDLKGASYDRTGL